MVILYSVLAWIGVVILFGLAVFIHEFGHFIAARLLGLRVDTFSIGFGPALWKKKVDGVEYRISAIPFGGYVALPQLDPSGMDKIQGKHGEENDSSDAEELLPDISPWRRIVVSFAGPFGNVVLAVALALLIFAVPGVKTGVIGTKIGFVDEDGDSWKAGLRAGDVILSVNGKDVDTWSDFKTECILAGDSHIAELKVQRGGEQLDFSVPLNTNNVLEVSLLQDVLPAATLVCSVSSVLPDSPAAKAGFASGDVVLAVNGKSIANGSDFIRAVATEGKDRPVAVEIDRAGERSTINVKPEYSEKLQRHVIGVSIGNQLLDTAKPWMMYKNPWMQLKWDSLSVIRVLQGLVTPKTKGERAAIAKNVGGPVAILSSLYSTVRGSIWDALGFLRLICINLAILNLLPIPVLDGGHIIFALYEIITCRKPNAKVVAVLVNICAVLLLGLMALLVWRDVSRQIAISRAEKAAAAEEE